MVGGDICTEILSRSIIRSALTICALAASCGLIRLICTNEEKRKAAMTDEQRELFKKYADCVREHQTNTD